MKRPCPLVLFGALMLFAASLAGGSSDAAGTQVAQPTVRQATQVTQPHQIFTNLAVTPTPAPMHPIRIGLQQQEYYRGSAVRITNITAQLFVYSYDQPQVEVTVNGPDERLIEAVGVITRSKTLVISDPMLDMNAVGFTHPEGFDGLTLNGKPREFIFLTVRVPKGTPVFIDHFIGYAEVGDDVGPLDAALQGESILNATSLVSATLTQEGAGSMYVEHVGNDLNVTQRGSGTVEIDNVDVFALFVESSANGSIYVKDGTARVTVASTARDGGFWFAGRTDYATVTAIDSSTISIAHVTNAPQVRYRDTPFVYFDKIGP